MGTRAPMKKTSLTLAALLAFALVAQTQVIPGVYQIVSGTYFDEGGIVGENVEALPRKSQMFISLSLDPSTATFRVRLLDRNFRPGLAFTNGVVSDHYLRFVYDTMYANLGASNISSVDYTATNSGDTLTLDGSVSISYDPCQCACNDCITRFGHSGVTAILTPVLTIRVTNGVDLCWGTTANRTYQAYYSADLRTNSWMSLGSSV
jgi:hypothetical protein